MFNEFDSVFSKYTLDELDRLGMLVDSSVPATYKQIGYIHGLLKKADMQEEELLKELDYGYMLEINPNHPLHELTITEAKEIIEYLIDSREEINTKNLRRF